MLTLKYTMTTSRNSKAKGNPKGTQDMIGNTLRIAATTLALGLFLASPPAMAQQNRAGEPLPAQVMVDPDNPEWLGRMGPPAWKR